MTELVFGSGTLPLPPSADADSHLNDEGSPPTTGGRDEAALSDAEDHMPLGEWRLFEPKQKQEGLATPSSSSAHDREPLSREENGDLVDHPR